MPKENVEIVRAAYEAYERGDLAGMLKDADPDQVIYRPDPDGRTYRGPEGFLQAFIDWPEGFDEFRASAGEFIDANDAQVIIRVHQHAVGSQSGVPIEADFWFVHTIKGRRIVRLDMYSRKAQALEAAGLRD
jgi:ketosteroid isomerase-like protein